MSIIKTANEILFEHGIDTMSMNDDFNSQLLHAMERYAEQKSKEPINNERDYAIRKGKVLERFKEGFFERFMYNALYRQVYESLIRNADPYDIIEKLIEINDEQMEKIKELVELMSVKKQ